MRLPSDVRRQESRCGRAAKLAATPLRSLLTLGFSAANHEHGRAGKSAGEERRSGRYRNRTSCSTPGNLSELPTALLSALPFVEKWPDLKPEQWVTEITRLTATYDPAKKAAT